ncbi:hypothetical protein CMUST_15005 [Corynebacterium mustelae]|uniref:Uncharacterized protein n=1 Tax=Corynebacterium mustelae TaxID=571915 RepID=A0A0G3H3F8_9CORY|nr:hypothetical protein [Corynebacterium mustelae]AKK07290.1 hypothetical protein CMUST_15005 [Corynebacterium mustelae]
MDGTTILTMASVFAGFLCFGGSFASFMYKKSPKLIWGLFSVAILLITVIPVVLAVFVSVEPR